MPTHTITVIPGDGIGPQITQATLRVLDALGCEIDYEQHLDGVAALDAGLCLLPDSTLYSFERHKVAL